MPVVSTCPKLVSILFATTSKVLRLADIFNNSLQIVAQAEEEEKERKRRSRMVEICAPFNHKFCYLYNSVIA